MGFMDWIIEKGKQAISFALKIDFTNPINSFRKQGGIIGKAQDLFCDTVDYFRYDQGFIATNLRVIDKGICTLFSLPIIGLEKASKFIYYKGGNFLGFSDEQLDKPIKKISDFVDDKIDKMMDYLDDKGWNVRFIGDFASVALHVLDYYSIGKLTRGATEKIRGIFNEGARRYKNRLIDQAKKMHDNNLRNVNQQYSHRQQINRQRYRENKALADAKRRIINEDYQKQKDKIRNMNVLKDPKYLNKILPKIIKDGLNDLFEFLKNTVLNLFWLIKEEYKSFWNNFWGGLSGKMGLYGFHTCPYGCGRPIPDAFKGCTELLQVFPDYFEKK